MPRAQRKTNNMGKANDKYPTKSSSPIEDSKNEFSLEINQGTDLKRTIIDILKEIKGENETQK